MARSKKASRARKAPPKARPESKGSTLPIIIGVVLAVAILAGIAYVLTRGTAPAGDGVLVTVNGKQILQSDLDFQYDLLPAAYKAQLTKEDVLEQIINEEVILQDGERKGITATDADVNDRVQQILAQNGMTPADLQTNLDSANITIEQFESLVRRQIVIERYNEQVIVVAEPDEQTLRGIYDLSPERFQTDPTVTARHILISSQRTDAAELSKDLYDRAREGEEFCAMVAEHTDDRGSKETCGEYTFPRGMMVPEFEEASFTMAPGDFQLVQTTFGYHIIEKIADNPASMTPYEEVKDALKAEFIAGERLRQYNIITQDLREKATIVYAGEESPTGAVVLEPEEPAEGNPLDELSEPAIIEPVPQEEAVVEPTDAAPAATEVTVTVTSPEMETKMCITGKAVLYGTAWSRDTKEARAMFEGLPLAYVACDEISDACADAGVSAYPTWVVDGVRYPGRMGLDELALAAGC